MGLDCALGITSVSIKISIPVDGGIVITEKLQSRTIHTEEVTVTTMWLANVVTDLAVQFVA